MRVQVHRRYDDTSKFERLLSVYFYTSNTDKLLQARLIFARNGYQLRNFTISREPYDEDYSLPTEEMLTKALHQISARYNVRSIFFVEDTSLRIEALSDEADFPGLQVKEWFASTSFAEVHRQITLRGGNRSAIVRSDIALYVPNLSKPIFFRGETRGVIAGTPPDFESSFQYPWLTPNTFNGWIIPNGAQKRLGEMEFEESLEFDFRAKSLLALIDRLGQLNAALNVPSNFYSVKRVESVAESQQPLLTGLLPVEKASQKLLLVIGHKCAGKTSFSDYLAANLGVIPTEASSVLRMLAWELDETFEGHAGALAFLKKHGMDCVARRIIDSLPRSEAPYQVVTGLRTTEELLLFKRHFPQSEVILIDTDPRIRFERHIRRARDQEVKTFREFIQQDEMQSQFGVMRLAHELTKHVINNDGTPAQYEKKIDDLLGGLDIPKGDTKSLTEMHKCLSALKRLGRAAPCDLIAQETELMFETGVRRYNTNRALKSIAEFATRSKRKGNLLSYRLNDRGSKLLELLDMIHRGNA